ncbi:hypothetical protein B0T20DRAFT_392407 [Sordaria brevicollis]|uniref:Uncharacterized protein n=1 Tax=Sordaria brevicollis TaxID=83679 RepID=A0AAE0UCR2_SORBR|nr:hypothetical protein B0T20DRAFT_392407 [Sordaria brevicollis]
MHVAAGNMVINYYAVPETQTELGSPGGMQSGVHLGQAGLNQPGLNGVRDGRAGANLNPSGVNFPNIILPPIRNHDEGNRQGVPSPYGAEYTSSTGTIVQGNTTHAMEDWTTMQDIGYGEDAIDPLLDFVIPNNPYAGSSSVASSNPVLMQPVTAVAGAALVMAPPLQPFGLNTPGLDSPPPYSETDPMSGTPTITIPRQQVRSQAAVIPQAQQAQPNIEAALHPRETDPINEDSAQVDGFDESSLNVPSAGIISPLLSPSVGSRNGAHTPFVSPPSLPAVDTGNPITPHPHRPNPLSHPTGAGVAIRPMRLLQHGPAASSLPSSAGAPSAGNGGPPAERPLCKGPVRNKVQTPCPYGNTVWKWRGGKSARRVTRCFDCLGNTVNPSLRRRVEHMQEQGLEPCSNCYYRTARGDGGGFCDYCFVKKKEAAELRRKRKHEGAGDAPGASPGGPPPKKDDGGDGAGGYGPAPPGAVGAVMSGIDMK